MRAMEHGFKRGVGVTAAFAVMALGFGDARAQERVKKALAGVARGPAPQHPAVEEEPPAQGTVLVVEDDPMQLEGIVMLLRDWGYRVLPTRGLAEACREAASRLPDIIVSDLRLTGPETGVEVIRTLWSRLGLRIPGVIVTGDTDPDRLRLVNAAEFRLVHKPFDPSVLRAIIARSLAALPPAMEPAAVGAA